MVSTLKGMLNRKGVMAITVFLEQIKERIREYNEGKLSKETLGNWAEIEYYKILKGRYLSIDELVAYPFFRIISRIHIVDDDVRDEYSCDYESLKYVYDILNGKKKYGCSICLGIPEQVFLSNYKESYGDRRKMIFELKNRLEKGIEFDKREHLDFIREFCLRKDYKEYTTLMDMLDCRIVSILECELDNKELMVSQFGLHRIKRGQNYDLMYLSKLVDGYLGYRNIDLYIIYKDGIPEIILI